MEQLEEVKVSYLVLSNELPTPGSPMVSNTHGELHLELEAMNLYVSLMSRANSWEIHTLTLTQSKAHFSTNDHYTRHHHRPYPRQPSHRQLLA